MNPTESAAPAAPAPFPEPQSDALVATLHASEAPLLPAARGLPVAFPWPDSIEVVAVPLAPVALREPSERRGEDRSKMSVYRSATLHLEGREALCLIRDLSASGLMCRTPAAATLGERVEVEMRSGLRIAGAVAWADDGKIGVGFDAPVDVAAALASGCVSSPSFIQRMPRLHIARPVTLRVEAGSDTATMLDLSQGGAKLEAPFLREGERVTLCIGGLEPRAGTVRWTKDGLAGITFVAPLRLDTLARWAAGRQPG